MKIQHFFDPETSTLTYIVFDPMTKDGLIIDPVLDFDPATAVVEDKCIKQIVDFVKQQGLNIHYILETHAHADHLSSSQILKKYFPKAKVAISKRITDVQKTFKVLFNFTDLNTNGQDFDYLIEDNENFQAGSINIKSIATPGHTPACTSFIIGNAVFTGDALFMPDSGTGRCDFPQGSAEQLYNSIMRLYELPDETQVYVGHDYQPNGRTLLFKTTIGESKKNNIQMNVTISKEQYIDFRVSRDKTLKAPRLLLPSLQVNIKAGHLPNPQSNGVSYLQLPLKLKLS